MVSLKPGWGCTLELNLKLPPHQHSLCQLPTYNSWPPPSKNNLGDWEWRMLATTIQGQSRWLRDKNKSGTPKGNCQISRTGFPGLHLGKRVNEVPIFWSFSQQAVIKYSCDLFSSGHCRKTIKILAEVAKVINIERTLFSALEPLLH